MRYLHRWGQQIPLYIEGVGELVLEPKRPDRKVRYYQAVEDLESPRRWYPRLIAGVAVMWEQRSLKPEKDRRAIAMGMRKDKNARVRDLLEQALRLLYVDAD